MSTYKVLLREVNTKVVEVQARDENEAEDIVLIQYQNGEIVMDDYGASEISADVV